jgi:rhodanese-related sulfurtransferase
MRRLIALSIVSLLAACGGGSSESTTTTTAETHASTGSESPRFAQISVGDVAARIATPDGHIAVFDANDRDTFAEHHVPGAAWVDYDAVSAETLPPDHATSLVFYCANEQCSASHVAATTAIDLGFTDVSVMGAGIDGWIASGQAVETAPSSGASVSE